MSEPTIKAIETVYNGYRFRSRLEARWAVFFDALGVKYEYEKEGFDLGEAGKYLPDFWLPKQKCWVEIKASEPSSDEESKAHALAKVSGYNVFIFFGDIPIPDEPYGADLSNNESAYLYMAEGWDNYYRWCICEICGAAGIEFEGRSERIECGCPGESDERHKERTANHRRLIKAFTSARQARFEHGESGSPRGARE